MKVFLFSATLTCFILFNLTVLAQAGTPDSTFSGDGKATPLDFGISASAAGIKVQPDGKIVVAGTSYDTNNNTRIFVLRYKSNGVVDSSFGINGITILSFYDTALERSIASGIALLPDGKIIVAGTIGNRGDFGIAKLNNNGSVDSSFGQSGKVTTTIGDIDVCTSLYIQNDGKILLAGYTFVNVGTGKTRITMARYRSSGKLDNSFGVKGILKKNYAHSKSVDAADIALQSDGKIILVGYTDGGYETLTMRLNIDGTTDSSFGINGGITYKPADLDLSDVTSVLVQPDDKIIVAGSLLHSGLLIRYLKDGTIDNNFGINGVSEIQSSSIQDIALQQDGKIVACGSIPVGGKTNFAVIRCQQYGLPDSSFGTNGFSYSSFSDADYNIANSLAIQNDGKICATGITNLAAGNLIVTARYNAGEIILPIKISGLYVVEKKTGNNVYADITWTIAQEEGVKYYAIERSFDASNWKLITQINSKAEQGNSNNPVSYTYNDDITSLKNTVIYYRIKQVDKNGHYTTSNIILLKRFSDGNHSIKISPNPAVGNIITVNIESPTAEKVSVLLLNTSGSVLYTQNNIELIEGANTINIPNNSLPNGIYFVDIIHSATKKKETIKVLL